MSSSLSSMDVSDTEVGETDAVSKVLSIPEILEEILLCVPGTTLIACKRVCKSWHEVINNMERCLTPLVFWRRLCRRDIPWSCLSDMCEFDVSADIDAAAEAIEQFLVKKNVEQPHWFGLTETLKWLKYYKHVDRASSWHDLFRIWMWADELSSCTCKTDVININEKIDDYTLRTTGEMYTSKGHMMSYMKTSHSRYVIGTCQEIGRINGSIICYDLLDNLIIGRSPPSHYIQGINNIQYVTTSKFYNNKQWIRTTSDSNIDDVCDDDGLSSDLLFIADSTYPQVFGSFSASTHEAHIRTYNDKRLYNIMNIMLHDLHPLPPEVSALYCDTSHGDTEIGLYNKPERPSTLELSNSVQRSRYNEEYITLTLNLYKQFRLPERGAIRVNVLDDRFSIIICKKGISFDGDSYTKFEFYTWSTFKSRIVCGHIFANIIVLVTANLRVYLYKVEFDSTDGLVLLDVDVSHPDKVINLRDIDEDIDRAVILSAAIDISPYTGPVILLSSNMGHLIKLLISAQ